MRKFLSMPLLIGWLAGLATVGVVGGVFALLVMFGGIYDTSATKPHLKIVAWAVHHTMTSAVDRRADDAQAPSTITPATVAAGARVYEARCAACHGAPGIARADWARAMLPTPPFLLDSRARWTPGELYKIVHDGVKMTAMPAWGEVESERHISAVVAFLQAMPQVSPQTYRRITAGVEVGQRNALPVGHVQPPPTVASTN